MLSTRVVRPFSKGVVSRASRSSGFSPVYVQATEMTGMSIFGKMSVGVRRMTAGLSKRMRIARTTNVYGRLRANLTIHMDVPLLGYDVHRKIRRSGGMPPIPSEVPRNRMTTLVISRFAPTYVRCVMRPLGLIYLCADTVSCTFDPETVQARHVHQVCQSRSEAQITFLDGA